MTPLDLVLERLSAVGNTPKRSGSAWTAKCPAHPDGNPSLSINEGRDGNAVLYCHAGCKLGDILQALNLEITDLFPPKPKSDLGEIIATYTYEDEIGQPVLRVNRHHPKTFRQMHWSNGTWVWGAGKSRKLLYRLPQVTETCANGGTVWLAEGEKDVHALEAAGVVATCNAAGAGKFYDVHADQLQGAGLVVIVCDNDSAGLDHVRKVSAELTLANIPYKIVMPAEGKDAHDHFATGHGIDEFVPVVSLDAISIEGITHDVMPSVTTDEPPLPLGTTHRHGPAFPLEVLPDWIADQCREIAYAFQVPEDLPAMLALGSLSTILAGHVKVNLTGSAWTEHVNLYLVSALLPGSGKSPVFKVMTKPVIEVEKESRAAAKKALTDYERERRINEQRIKHHETIAVKGTIEEQRSAIEEISLIDGMLDRQVRPPAGHLVSEDITPEALVEELAANGGRMALLSSEGGVFDMMAGQYVDKGKATNLAVYLQGWSADSVRRKRTKGEAIVIDEALLTVCVTTQPGVVEALGANRELVTKGVPVRFMFSVPPSLVGYRDRRRVLENIDSVINATYQDLMTKIGLAALASSEIKVLRTTSAAGERFLEWDQTLEERQKPGGDLADRAEWAAKLRATVLRCCGILHVADGAAGDMVQIDTVERAIVMANYWLAHADVVEKMWSDDQVTVRARTIVRWSLDNDKPEFSLRDITVAKRGTFPAAEEAVAPLQALVDRGWITPLQEGPVEVMGRGTPSQRFRLREDARQWLDSSAQPSQLPENGQVARVVMVVHENGVSNHSLLPHNFGASENPETSAQPSQPSQLAATGTDDFMAITDHDDPDPNLPDLF